MFNAPDIIKKNKILASSASLAILASFGLYAVFDDGASQIDIGEDAVLSVGLRLNQYAPVSQLPSWLQLPDRSTAAFGSVLADADSNRIYFRSLSSARAIEEHFRQLLLANGFQLAFVRPASSVTGVASLITAFDAEATRSVQITVRDGKAARSVEVFSRGPAWVAAKGLSIGS